MDEEDPCPDVSTALFDDPDLAVVGIEQFSQGASDMFGSPRQAAAVDVEMPTLQHYSNISASSSPAAPSLSVVPETDVTPSDIRPSSLALESEPEVILLGEDTALPPRRPQIQPEDILAAVRCTPVDRAAAVARRLADQYDIGH